MSLSSSLFVILNAVKDLALGLCRNICEILRVAQNDINEETNADDNANVIPYSTVEDYSNRVLSNKVIRRHKKRREALHCRSLHVLRLVGIALFVGTSNVKAPRCMYTNNPAVPKVAIGVRVHQWP